MDGYLERVWVVADVKRKINVYVYVEVAIGYASCRTNPKSISRNYRKY